MAGKVNKKIIRKKIEPKIDKIKSELDHIVGPKTIKEGERLHRELSVLSTEDLLRPFTI